MNGQKSRYSTPWHAWPMTCPQAAGRLVTPDFAPYARGLLEQRMPDSRQLSNQRRFACVVPKYHIPTTGRSPCAADCIGRLTAGMTRDFADDEVRATAVPHACATSAVFAVNTERPSGPGVCTS